MLMVGDHLLCVRNTCDAWLTWRAVRSAKVVWPTSTILAPIFLTVSQAAITELPPRLETPHEPHRAPATLTGGSA